MLMLIDMDIDIGMNMCMGMSCDHRWALSPIIRDQRYRIEPDIGTSDIRLIEQSLKLYRTSEFYPISKIRHPKLNIQAQQLSVIELAYYFEGHGLESSRRNNLFSSMSDIVMNSDVDIRKLPISE